MRLGSVCAEVLADLASGDGRIWVLDGDLGDSYGLERFIARHPKRFVNCGIAEQTMVSAAAGMAACGARPFVFSFASFVCYRAYDQIRTCISQTNLPVTIVGSHAGGCGGRNGKSHVALNDIALLTTLPNMTVWSPCDADDVHLALTSTLKSSRPAYIRLPRDPVPTLSVAPAPMRWIGRPHPVALCGHGYSTHWALAAQADLATAGHDVGVFSMQQLWPIDDVLLKSLLAGVELLIVIEDHYRMGGISSLLSTVGACPNILSVGWPDTWSGQSGDSDTLRKKYGLDAGSLCELVASKLPVLSHARRVQRLQTP